MPEERTRNMLGCGSFCRHSYPNGISSTYACHQSEVVVPGQSCALDCTAFTAPAADINECKRLCVGRRCGAFVVLAGVAYFKERAAKHCRGHLLDHAHAQTFLCEDPCAVLLSFLCVSFQCNSEAPETPNQINL